jgi:hypothetical protein
MDPNENLKQQREIIARMFDPESEHVDSGDALELAQLVQDLDEWISKGGVVPRAWALAVCPVGDE